MTLAIVTGCEPAAERGGSLEHREELATDHRPGYAHVRALVAHLEGTGGVSGDGCEAVVMLLKASQERGAEGVVGSVLVIVLHDGDNRKLVGVRNRKRAEQDAIEEREDSNVCAKAES